MSENSTASAISSASATLVQLTFVVLKLTHVVDWSWWIVFLPTIIPLSVLFFAIVVTIILGLSIIGKRNRR